MTWTSVNRRMLRRSALALGTVFGGGVLLLFWSPLAGLLVMLAAAVPVIAMTPVAITILVRSEAAAKRARAKDGT
jgi:hypothetical protein